jgi:two-component system sensor histidine kinase/response regulator
MHNDLNLKSTMRDILIVDDAPNNLRLLAAILNQFGYEVRSSISGKMALIAAQNSPPDLILLDINMPDMDGYEVCKQLRDKPETAGIPVIFLTAYSQTKDKVRAFKLGAQDYITKPFQADEVIARIENQLALMDAKKELEVAREAAVVALQKEQEANRIKSEFLSMIYHDFKAPLTTIQAYVGLLQGKDQKVPQASSQTNFFQRIEASIEFMIHLIDNLLIANQVHTETLLPHLSSVDLLSLCRDITETVQLGYGAEHHVEFCTELESLKVETDPNLLRQILTNLLMNAVKYSPSNSTVRLELTYHPHRVYFRVLDQGIGIESSELDKIFEPFYRSRGAAEFAKGNGLGLAATQRCIDSLQGDIDIVSEINQGTIITVSIPVSE